MKKLIAALFIGFIAIILLRTLMFSPPEIATEDKIIIDVDAATVAQHLSEAVQFQTISPPRPEKRNFSVFDNFLEWAEQTYPELHSLEKTIVKEHTILLKWPGRNPTLKPILLAAHYDVVPVVPGTEDRWTHPPFGGVIDNGFVWGRGSLDDKSGVIVMMEAATLLLRQGFTPERSVYFSFDHDEEIGGTEGALGVTELFKEQGIQLAWSIDEGSFILNNIYPGVEMPVASINVAEKGYLTLDLTANGDSGHSSMPTKDASIFLLAEAISRLRATPLSGGLEGISLEAMETIAQYSTFSRRLFFANRWLFQGLIEDELSKSGPTNAMLRTTTAPTLLSAGIKDNILPGTAMATVNFRLHPRDTLEGVIDAVTTIINDDRIEIQRRGTGSLPSKVSSTDGMGYEIIAKVSRQMFGPLITIPGITGGGTNSSHYETVADDSYRINLLSLGPDDIAGFHGTNERISVENLGAGTAAYAQLITLGASQ
ncbi:MAG: carboxypeptidase PM20D1 [Oceanicoccus sp.]|jgi:carboxypeptidase PM20D1